MGGNAFRHGPMPIKIRRMRKSLYTIVKRWAHESLGEEFTCVATPIEGPGKEDFGDLDLLLALPKQRFTSKEETLACFYEILKPIRVVMDGGDKINVHLAVEWPAGFTRRLKPQYGIESPSSDESETDATESEKEAGEEVDSGEEADTEEGSDSGSAHDAEGQPVVKSAKARGKGPARPKPQKRPRVCQNIQVDIRVCTNLKEMQWDLFIHAHGDIWIILGSILRPYGLTVNDKALWIRIPQIENEDRKLSMIKLTDEPGAVLSFLGLKDGPQWEEPFDSVEAMFQYITTCKFFSTAQLNVHAANFDDHLIKPKDRRQMEKRPVFRTWIEEFLPECRQLRRFQKTPMSREDVKKLAFETFPCKNEYNARLKVWRWTKCCDIVIKIIKNEIPEADPEDPVSVCYRATLVKAMKRIILDDDDRYGVVRDFRIMDDNGYYNVSAIRYFVAKYMVPVGQVAMAASHEHYMRRVDEARDMERAEALVIEDRLRRASQRAEMAARERTATYF